MLDLFSADGKAWFFVDRLMYELIDGKQRLAVRTMDLRITPELAARIGRLEVAGWVIADMERPRARGEGVWVVQLAPMPATVAPLVAPGSPLSRAGRCSWARPGSSKTATACRRTRTCWPRKRMTLWQGACLPR